MISLQEYKNLNEDFNIELLNICPINESVMFMQHGSTFDSIFEKMHKFSHNSQNNYINESYNEKYDVFFNESESNAARDLLLYTSRQYAYALLLENGIIDENFLIEGIFDKIKDFAKEKVEGVKKGLNFLQEKLKKLYDFLKELVKNGINSVKELVYKITDMMLSFGCKVDDLFEKLKIDKKKALNELFLKIKLAFKDKKTHVNVYENQQNTVIESFIIEDDDKNDEETDYDKAKNADPTTASEDDVRKKSWGGLIGNALALVLIQALAYYAVCVIMPAIFTLLGGPVAGAIAECVAKIIWSSGVIFHQVRAEYKLHHSGEYEKRYGNSKIKKFIHNVFFLFNICWAAWKALSGIIDMVKIINAFVSANENIIKGILPSEAVQCFTKWLNDGWKAIVGKNASGFDEMQEHIDAIETGILKNVTHKVKKTVEQTEHTGMDAEQCKTEFENVNWNDSQSAVNFMTKNKMSTDAINKLADGNKVTAGFDGFFDPSKNEWSKNALNTLIKGGYSESEAMNILKGQAFNKGLNAMNSHAGSMGFVEMPAKALKMLVNGGCTSANGNPIVGLGVDIHKTVIKTMTKTFVKHFPVNAIVNHFDWFGGFFELPTFSQAKKTGEWFLLRLSSGHGKGKQYDIKDSKDFTFKEAEAEFSDKNPSIFNDMRKIIENNNKLFKEFKSQIKESNDDNSNNEKINDKEELMKQIENEKTLFVLYGVPYKKSNNSKKKQSAEESFLNTLYADDFINETENEEKSDDNKEDLIPVAIFNSMLMCVGDLASGRKSGPRKHVIYYRGMQASYEILPKDGCMSEQDIKKWLIELLQNSFKVCYDINPISPCYKKFGKWKINDNAPKGNREDFGNFTNDELLEIANGSEDIDKFFGGANYSSRAELKNVSLEQTHNDRAKKQHQQNLERWVNFLKNDEKVTAVLNKYPNLKKKLIKDNGDVNIDEIERIYPDLSRIERGFRKKKKGFFSRLKDKIFGSNKHDELYNYDPEEFRELTYELHSAKVRHTKNQKLNDNFENTFIEHELLMEYYNYKEFFDYVKTGKINEDNEKQLKPEYNSLKYYLKTKIY